MGRVHNSYCYETPQQAVDSFNSESGRFFGVDNGFGEMHAHSDFGIYMHYYPVTGQGPPHSFTGHYLPECTIPGPLNSIVYGIDWTVVEWIFGAGLVMFATGAAVGSVINIVRKARI